MGTHYSGGTRERLALDTFIKLSRSTETIHSYLTPRLADHDLTTGQFGVLEALYHLGAMPQVNIGRKLLKSPGNITVVLDNLERRSLVERKRDPADRRKLLVNLTETGTALIERIFPLHVAAIVTCFQSLSESEQEQLGKLCRKLGIGGQARHKETD